MTTNYNIIATFIPKISLDWFLKYLSDKFKIDKKRVFIYEIENNDNEYLITFSLSKNKKVDLKVAFNNATVVHVQNGCIFSINGLNRLIEEIVKTDVGNVNYKSVKVNWEDYRSKLILSNKNNDMIIKSIKKVN